jgi:hypothetical protein
MRYLETTKGSATLWIVQGLLAVLYLFAGGMKLLMPLDALAAQAHLPGTFMKFIGICEVAGALGLILPGLLRIARVLTPLAASGLLVIMIGATSLTVARMGLAPAVLPLVAGLLDAFVLYGRWPRAWGRYSEPHPVS